MTDANRTIDRRTVLKMTGTTAAATAVGGIGTAVANEPCSEPVFVQKEQSDTPQPPRITRYTEPFTVPEDAFEGLGDAGRQMTVNVKWNPPTDGNDPNGVAVYVLGQTPGGDYEYETFAWETKSYFDVTLENELTFQLQDGGFYSGPAGEGRDDAENVPIIIEGGRSYYFGLYPLELTTSWELEARFECS